MGKVKKNKKNSTPAQVGQFGLQHPHSAGIDIGSMLMVVSYTGRDGNNHVAEFNSFTDSLLELAALLSGEKVVVATMEATGPYWKVLFGILEQHGIKVVLVNPSHYRNVSARKTDVNDAQWLHQLLAHGLLRDSHIAPGLYRELRSYLHEREVLRQQKSDTLNRIQKVLTLMNIKFQHLISDIEGVSGMLLLRAIGTGKREPEALLKLVDLKRLKASPEDLLSSLKGDYQHYYTNILSESLKSYDFAKAQMEVYENYIEGTLQKLLPKREGAAPPVKPKKGMVRKNQYRFNLKSYLHAIFGVDLTEVPGLDEISLLAILAVTGTDMSKWPTAGHFASWLNLSPRPKVSGGKVIGYEKRITNNPATQAFRMAANSLWQNKGPLGQQYKKLASSKGASKAIKAIARKLAVIFYNMVLRQEAYDAAKVQPDIALQEARQLARLRKKAALLGCTIQKAA